jgi:hypothetical protein
VKAQELMAKAAKSNKAAASAKVLLDTGDADGACNRAYYAMLDQARAVLLVSSCISLRYIENCLAPAVLGANRSHSPAMARICNDAMWDAKQFECSRTYATRH